MTIESVVALIYDFFCCFVGEGYFHTVLLFNNFVDNFMNSYSYTFQISSTLFVCPVTQHPSFDTLLQDNFSVRSACMLIVGEPEVCLTSLSGLVYFTPT